MDEFWNYPKDAVWNYQPIIELSTEPSYRTTEGCD